MDLNKNLLNSIISESLLVDTPWAHTIVENFLPSDFLQKLVGDVRSLENGSPTNFFESTYGLKAEYREFPKNLPHLATWMNYLNSKELMETLGYKFKLRSPEKLTSDNSYDGGGYSISPPNSYLASHADFNFSSHTEKFRVMNVLFYFNENYDDAFGGHLNLLDSDSKTVKIRIPPKMNTLVAFLTDDVSYHGVSKNASNFSRRSFNIYYYADLPLSDNQSLEPHKTIWIEPANDRPPHLKTKNEYMPK